MSVLLNTVDIKRTDFYNEITVKYGYDYANEDFIGTYTYPESDATNPSFQLYGKKRAITIRMPIHYTLAAATLWAKRYYGLYAFGILTTNQTTNLHYLEQFAFTPEYGYDYTKYHEFRINKKSIQIGKKVRLYLTGWRQEVDHINAWDI